MINDDQSRGPFSIPLKQVQLPAFAYSGNTRSIECLLTNRGNYQGWKLNAVCTIGINCCKDRRSPSHAYDIRMVAGPKDTKRCVDFDENSIERAREYSRLYRRGRNRLKLMVSEVLEPHGITEPQYTALLWISDHPGIIQVDLAVELDSDPSTISAILRQLDKQKLVHRRRGLTDGRALSLVASKRGKELVSVVRPQIDHLTQRILALVPPGHETALLMWLQKLSQFQI